MRLTVTGKQIDIGETLQTHVGDAFVTSISDDLAGPPDRQAMLSRGAQDLPADAPAPAVGGIAAPPAAGVELAAGHAAERRRHGRRQCGYRDGAVEIGKAPQYVLADAENEEVDAGGSGGRAVLAGMADEGPRLAPG